jgi:hypothetical protein
MCTAGEDSKWAVVENVEKKRGERKRENILPKGIKQNEEPYAF